MRTCVVAGSFDPITNGHVDIIREASMLFDEVFVAVLCNTSKNYMFSTKERLELVDIACRGIVGANIRTLTWDGLLVALLDKLGTDFVVRGLRDGRDVDAERQMSAVNARLRPNTRTIWVSGSLNHWSVSSTIVRELITFNADISEFVPPLVVDRIVELRARNV